MDKSAIKDVLLKRNPNLKVLLKLGSKGCEMITKDYDIPMSVVGTYNKQIMEDYKIVNTTWAGDCFTAAFMVKYSEYQGIYLWYFNKFVDSKEDEQEIFKKCMIFANACAFLCITREGLIFDSK